MRKMSFTNVGTWVKFKRVLEKRLGFASLWFDLDCLFVDYGCEERFYRFMHNIKLVLVVEMGIGNCFGLLVVGLSVWVFSSVALTRSL